MLYVQDLTLYALSFSVLPTALQGSHAAVIFPARVMWAPRPPGAEQTAWSHTARQSRGGLNTQRLAPGPADLCGHRLELELHPHTGVDCLAEAG